MIRVGQQKGTSLNNKKKNKNKRKRKKVPRWSRMDVNHAKMINKERHYIKPLVTYVCLLLREVHVPHF